MAKNDNPHALRFIASIEKKFEWAQNICEFLNDTYDDETIKAVRMDCACVKRIDQTLPKAWCYCTLGYTKKCLNIFLMLKSEWSCLVA